ncbi:hypothetical protein TorRG33x02_170150 [Trema orientale]|uniref:Uncharacterized protein n=1 Tax=Trema orientale TaxID=63057 RepID=A0A2P5ENT8_TREOI|nr:hypothetical protein TorRG33x02_170150 [Trema orientale]
MGGFSLLSLVVLLFYSPSNADESTALLQFKSSFSVYNLYTPDDYCYGKSKTNSWKNGTNWWSEKFLGRMEQIGGVRS